MLRICIEGKMKERARSREKELDCKNLNVEEIARSPPNP